MGPAPSKSDQLYPPEMYQKVEPAQIVNDERYGPVQILKEINTPSKAAVSAEKVPDEATLNSREQQARAVQGLDHAGIAKLLNQFSVSHKDACSSVYELQLLYEYLDSDLKKNMAARLSNGQRYSIPELWYILTAVSTSLAYLQQHGISHGNICPAEILVNHDGKIKLLQKPAFNAQMPAYEKHLLGYLIPENGIYLSPALWAALPRKEPSPIHNKYSSDIFSLGVSILEAAGGASVNDIYNQQNYTVDQQKIRQYLDKIGAKSPDLSKVLAQMLQIEETARPEPERVYKLLEECQTRGIMIADRLSPTGPTYPPQTSAYSAAPTAYGATTTSAPPSAVPVATASSAVPMAITTASLPDQQVEEELLKVTPQRFIPPPDQTPKTQPTGQDVRDLTFESTDTEQIMDDDSALDRIPLVSVAHPAPVILTPEQYAQTPQAKYGQPVPYLPQPWTKEECYEINSMHNSQINNPSSMYQAQPAPQLYTTSYGNPYGQQSNALYSTMPTSKPSQPNLYQTYNPQTMNPSMTSQEPPYGSTPVDMTFAPSGQSGLSSYNESQYYGNPIPNATNTSQSEYVSYGQQTYGY